MTVGLWKRSSLDPAVSAWSTAAPGWSTPVAPGRSRRRSKSWPEPAQAHDHAAAGRERQAVHVVVVAAELEEPAARTGHRQRRGRCGSVVQALGVEQAPLAQQRPDEARLRMTGMARS